MPVDARAVRLGGMPFVLRPGGEIHRAPALTTATSPRARTTRRAPPGEARCRRSPRTPPSTSTSSVATYGQRAEQVRRDAERLQHVLQHEHAAEEERPEERPQGVPQREDRERDDDPAPAAGEPLGPRVAVGERQVRASPCPRAPRRSPCRGSAPRPRSRPAPPRPPGSRRRCAPARPTACARAGTRARSRARWRGRRTGSLTKRIRPIQGRSASHGTRTTAIFASAAATPMYGLPSRPLRPTPSMASARPDTTWFARSVMLAKACSSDTAAPAATAASMPSQGLPVATAVMKPVTAPTDIMPSTPRLRMPDRSATISPRVPSRSGVPAASARSSTVTTIGSLTRRSGPGGHGCAGRSRRRSGTRAARR